MPHLLDILVDFSASLFKKIDLEEHVFLIHLFIEGNANNSSIVCVLTSIVKGKCNTPC